MTQNSISLSHSIQSIQQYRLVSLLKFLKFLYKELKFINAQLYLSIHKFLKKKKKKGLEFLDFYRLFETFWTTWKLEMLVTKYGIHKDYGQNVTSCQKEFQLDKFLSKTLIEKPALYIIWPTTTH